MFINTETFEKFLLDGGVYSPDMYDLREHEDFSPEGALGVGLINRFAENRVSEIKYGMIA